MKKIIVFLLVVFLMLAMSACTSDGSADIWIFADSFNNRSDAYQIELADVSLVTDEGVRTYECFIDVGNGKNILLTLDAADDGTITKLSVTSAAADKIPASVFCTISETAADVLTQESGENVSDTFKTLGMLPPENVGKTETAYFETNICRYSLVSNQEGTMFMAELVKYFESTTEPLSLRDDSETDENPVQTSDGYSSEETTGYNATQG